MDIFISDPSEIPLPPDEVRIRQIKFALSEDFHRFRIFIELDPFQKRPNIELKLLSPTGEEASHADIIETMHRKMELTLHLRIDPQPGEYRLNVVLYYSAIHSEPDFTDEANQRNVVDQSSEVFLIE